ncbi:hypothetical protein [Salinimicrobium xinjiangense]|uniref:hypothetical protein n=1 Tax=Salinimicrobium xinjiangense TaxID=438596 RepID=UPI00040204D4|nr:hypothetical protein [Salinimicrobium xinjiangense]
MKIIISLSLLFSSLNIIAQNQNPLAEFWEKLEQHCGQAYEGKVVAAPENDDFRNKKLVMHVRSCAENQIKIPFFVGDDRSRTWVLSKTNGKLELKHDHRHKDGSEDEVTMYGGTASNHGQPHLQVFPADQQTADLLPLAASNVWWITLTDTGFTYNLRRLGTDRFFSVEFDLTQPVKTPAAPWGWEE